MTSFRSLRFSRPYEVVRQQRIRSKSADDHRRKKERSDPNVRCYADITVGLPSAIDHYFAAA